MKTNDLKTTVQELQRNNVIFNAIYDVGANKGNWTREHQSLFPGAIFYMFEANPVHKDPNIPYTKWFNVVLSDPDTDSVSFYSINGTGDSYYKEQTKHYENVFPQTLPTKTLDDVMNDNYLIFPNVIKLDVQGAELDVLKGISDHTISETKLIMMEVPVLPYNEDAPKFDEYINYMYSRGFVPFGVEKIHFGNNILIQMDIVFMQKDIKNKFYGDNHLFNERFNL